MAAPLWAAILVSFFMLTATFAFRKAGVFLCVSRVYVNVWHSIQLRVATHCACRRCWNQETCQTRQQSQPERMGSATWEKYYATPGASLPSRCSCRSCLQTNGHSCNASMSIYLRATLVTPGVPGDHRLTPLAGRHPERHRGHVPLVQRQPSLRDGLQPRLLVRRHRAIRFPVPRFARGQRHRHRAAAKPRHGGAAVGAPHPGRL